MFYDTFLTFNFKSLVVKLRYKPIFLHFCISLSDCTYLMFKNVNCAVASIRKTINAVNNPVINPQNGTS